MQTYTYLYIHAYIHTWTHTRDTQTHAHIHRYTIDTKYTHTHIHTDTYKRPLSTNFTLGTYQPEHSESMQEARGNDAQLTLPFPGFSLPSHWLP